MGMLMRKRHIEMEYNDLRIKKLHRQPALAWGRLSIDRVWTLPDLFKESGLIALAAWWLDLTGMTTDPLFIA